jgi:hypothetical protein
VQNFEVQLLGLGKAAQGLGPAVQPSLDGLRGLGDQFRRAGAESDKLADKIKGIPKPANTAGFALQNLGRVASDAPFGFIAIQNNIEPLLESFTRLKTQSGGTGAAIKALGASLAGPAGLLLGFSLVSSAVTVAIQKYGSVGKAVEALFGNYSQLDKDLAAAAKSYEKFNETVKTSTQIIQSEGATVAGSISRVDALAKIVDDQTKSYNERNAALNQLKAINKDYFGDLDIEAGKVTGLKDAVFGYNAQLKATAIIKGFESQIGATNVELQKQKDILDQLKPAYDAALKSQQKLGEASKVTASVGVPGFGGASRPSEKILPAFSQFLEQQKVVNTLQASLNNLNKNIDNSVAEFTRLRAPVDAATEAKNLLAQSSANLSKATKVNTSEQDKLARALEKQNAEFDKLQSNFKKLARANETDLSINAQFQAENPAQAPTQQRPFSQYDLIQAQLGLEKFNQQILNLQQNAMSAGMVMMDFLTPVIDGVFSAIENGESIFESIGQSLKKLVLQLVATIAKAAILAAIFSVITGGVGGAGLAIGGGVSKGFGSIFGKLLGGATAGGGGGGSIFGALGAVFGGVSGQSTGMAMQGQVVFRQSGSDLVGVLNRTNGRINRVG